MQTTKRHPRTLEEAFGPYARGAISEPYTPMNREDKIIIGFCTTALVGVLAAIFFGVL